jgi:AcrR family transcriptional regulator
MTRQADAVSETGRVGRPRRFAGDVERQLIMDAGLRVMTGNGYIDAAVSDVLVEAGVSTRAFYRHFDTKDALVLALFRRDAEAVGRLLQEATDAAESPLDALDAWIDGFLDLFYEPRRARRTALFAAAAVRRAEGYHEEMARTQDLLRAPLIDVLRRGQASGVLRSAESDHDARTILAIASSIAEPVGNRRFPERAQARAHLVRFCWPALGLTSQESLT